MLLIHALSQQVEGPTDCMHALAQYREETLHSAPAPRNFSSESDRALHILVNTGKTFPLCPTMEVGRITAIRFSQEKILLAHLIPI